MTRKSRFVRRPYLAVATPLTIVLATSGCVQYTRPPVVSSPVSSTYAFTSLTAETGLLTSGAPNPGGGVSTESGGTTAPKRISLVRYIGADASKWPEKPGKSTNIDKYAGFADLYTRFVLLQTTSDGSETQGLASGGPIRDYSREERSPLARAFAKKTNSVIAVANVTLLNPDLKLTVPLYSVTYASGGGVKNQWSSSLTSSHIRSPLFRIQADSRASIQLNTHVSTEVESRGFAQVLRAVTTAVSIAAPEAGILTKLSGDETNAKASALDSALSSLLSSDIVENLEVDRPVSTWEPTAEIAITGCAPFVRVEAGSGTSADGSCAQGPDLDKGSDHLVGRWALTLSCPQYSVFSARTICNESNAIAITTTTQRSGELSRIASAVVDSQILSFALSSQVAMRDYIRGRPWFTTFIAKSAPSATDYANLCGLAMNELQDQGLTGFDSALAVRAMFRLMPELLAKDGDPKSDAAVKPCRDLVGRYEVLF